jgi:hypothetical protein
MKLALSNGPNRVGVPSTHPKMETYPVFKILCFIVVRISDDGESPQTH